MGTVDDVRSISRSNIVCLEGNGIRPSHMGDGWRVGTGGGNVPLVLVVDDDETADDSE